MNFYFIIILINIVAFMLLVVIPFIYHTDKIKKIETKIESTTNILMDDRRHMAHNKIANTLCKRYINCLSENQDTLMWPHALRDMLNLNPNNKLVSEHMKKLLSLKLTCPIIKNAFTYYGSFTEDCFAQIILELKSINRKNSKTILDYTLKFGEINKEKTKE